MAVVRHIFEEVAAGTPMWAVKVALETEEVPAPGGGKRWSQTTLREMIQSDSYRPHTVEELLELVPATVAASLDPDKRYGVSWYGRRRTRNKQVAETGADGTRRYRRKQETTARPREEWIGVPVPDSGRLEALERDADALLASYAGMVPEALDALSPEERQRVYKMMHLKVHTYADGSIALDGVFASGGGFYAENGSSLRAASRGRSARPHCYFSETASTTSWSPQTAAPQETRPGG
jgi:hypothetical protein